MRAFLLAAFLAAVPEGNPVTTTKVRLDKKLLGDCRALLKSLTGTDKEGLSRAANRLSAKPFRR